MIVPNIGSALFNLGLFVIEQRRLTRAQDLNERIRLHAACAFIIQRTVRDLGGIEAVHRQMRIREK